MSKTPDTVVRDAITQTEHVIRFHGIAFPCKYDALGQTFSIYTAHANQSRILSQALNEHKIYEFSVYTDPPASRFEFANAQDITTLSGMMQQRSTDKGAGANL